MTQVGKFLILIGLFTVFVGAVVWTLGRFGFKGLPGDIRYESNGIRIYIPVVTCVILSIVLTLVFWLWQWLSRR